MLFNNLSYYQLWIHKFVVGLIRAAALPWQICPRRVLVIQEWDHGIILHPKNQHGTILFAISKC